ncbi:MAG: glycosyltransferase family 2 protein [Verrucomicrobia bacterium]|nr:glycosyltransferase family 2 protein [Verrucomicrobiota bacterium]
MPDVSLILVSHNKPQFVKEAVQSVLAQTHQNWEAILVDSGVLLRQGFFDYLKDPRFRVVPSGETPELAKTKNMASWCFNRLLNAGEVHGELVVYLCDDDLIYPEMFAAYWNYYTQRNHEPQAMYSSQDIGVVYPDGQTKIIGQRLADKPAGKFCQGRKLDCQVDYLQFCHTLKILEKVRAAHGTTEYHLEDKSQGHHADGIFLERVGALTTVHPVPPVLSMNRRTADSVNIQHTDSFFGKLQHKLRCKWREIAFALRSR